ncbi:hypothetical protein [Brucella gallinifaecis]|uniref:hypothetical protein n=1 Tax=Brucella gallinifaecis TaxID=215590 RepID=UPI00235E6636|nr:hypothetical protein [Brucella gallinifaecis]
MVIVDRKICKLRPAIFFFAAIGILSGCTTTTNKSSLPCNSREVTNLRKQIEPTKFKLKVNQRQLTLIRSDLYKESCSGGIFSPTNKSATCERLKKQEESLITERRSLEERLAEISAAIAGQSYSGKHINSCKAAWLPIRTNKKSATKNADMKVSAHKRQVGKLAKIDKVPKADASIIEDYIVPASSPPETNKLDPVAYTSSGQPLSQSPNYVAPAAISPPTERSYSDSSKVRVIGSSFFPDQLKPVDPQAPDHAPAP